MKSTGVVRRIDELGRIVIPKEIRKNLGIREGENLEIFIEENKIVLQKQMIMDNAKQITEKLVNLVLDIYDINITVTNRDSVVISTDSDIKVDEKISNKLVKIMVVPCCLKLIGMWLRKYWSSWNSFMTVLLHYLVFIILPVLLFCTMFWRLQLIYMLVKEILI